MKMKNSRGGLARFLIWSISIALLIGLYFSENIRGYYRFKSLCEKEAGARTFESLQPGVGWMVAGGRPEETEFLVAFEEIAFVRYRSEKDGNLYDVHRVPKLKVGDSSYVIRPADLSKTVVYEYRVTQGRVKDEARLGISRAEVLNLQVSAVVYSYTKFGYSKFDPDRTFLGAPSGEACPDDVWRVDPKTGKRLLSLEEQSFIHSFAR